MSEKKSNKKEKNTLIKSVEKKYGVNLGYENDNQLYKSLNERGLPSLSKLLKMSQKSA